mgnify:CR=1 FL=1
MKSLTINDALYALGCDGGWKVKDGVISGWTCKTPQPSNEAIQAKLTELQNAEPMRLLRLERNQKLSETDWWCASDRTPTQAQLDYRTALRDLPSTASPSLDENGNLTGVEWPNKPE